jgi:GNAT superfamily N-acetyltransferase
VSGSSEVRIRPATAGDGPVVRDLERRAGLRFAEVGLAEVADHEPPSLEHLAGVASDGRSAVAVAPSGEVVGYVLVDRVDSAAHVEQVSVDPDHQGRGVGRALLAWVEGWARGEGCRALTLTTFRDVPWNAPLYAHLGFRELAADEVGPGLATVVSEEAALGLDPATRVCMRRDLTPD